jgi:FkbM family methyltransferase
MDGDFAAPELGETSAVWSRVEVGDGSGFGVYAEGDDPISRAISVGEYPAEYASILQLARAIVEPGGLVLDLGAHIGIFSLAAAAAGFRVVAVEASPRNAALLAASAERNHFPNLRVMHAAVSDGPGILELCDHGPYVHVAPPNAGIPIVPVPAISVDLLLKEFEIGAVDFIKMDIEGCEVAAIRGMRELLRQPDAPPIFYECNGHTLAFLGNTPADLKAAIESLGYGNYIPGPGKLVPVAAQEFQPFTVVDYLALKRLPPALRHWRLDGPMPFDAIVSRVLSSTASADVCERRYIARSLFEAPARVRANSQVKVALASLRRDPDEQVRALARAVVVPSWLEALLMRIGPTAS